MNIYAGLLFLQGHITNTDLARQLAGAPTADANTDASGAAPRENERDLTPSRPRSGSTCSNV